MGLAAPPSAGDMGRRAARGSKPGMPGDSGAPSLGDVPSPWPLPLATRLGCDLTGRIVYSTRKRIGLHLVRTLVAGSTSSSSRYCSAPCWVSGRLICERAACVGVEPSCCSSCRLCSTVTVKFSTDISTCVWRLGRSVWNHEWRAPSDGTSPLIGDVGRGTCAASFSIPPISSPSPVSSSSLPPRSTPIKLRRGRSEGRDELPDAAR